MSIENQNCGFLMLSKDWLPSDSPPGPHITIYFLLLFNITSLVCILNV